MIRILFVLLIALTPALNSRGFSQAPKPGPVLEFEDLKQGFGMVKEGEIVALEYKYKNTGDAPVVITETKVSCTCTSVDFPKEPILPGQAGSIKVKFDTKNKYDRQDRVIQVISNSTGSPIIELRFKGVVLKKK